MDERKPQVKSGGSLPLEDQVYRIALVSWREKKNKSVPSTRCFDLTERDGNKLSVDWSGLTTPEESIARVGASFKFGKEEYKESGSRELYALEISFLNTLKEIEEVIYDPIINTPSIKGQPNNLAHSLIIFNEDVVNDKLKRPEIILKLRDHAKSRRVEVNTDQVNDLVEEYRNLNQ